MQVSSGSLLVLSRPWTAEVISIRVTMVAGWEPFLGRTTATSPPCPRSSAKFEHILPAMGQLFAGWIQGLAASGTDIRWQFLYDGIGRIERLHCLSLPEGEAFESPHGAAKIARVAEAASSARNCAAGADSTSFNRHCQTLFARRFVRAICDSTMIVPREIRNSGSRESDRASRNSSRRVSN